MSAPATAVRAAAPPRRVVLLGRELRVLLPSRGDPRLKLAVIVIALQVLGQTVLNFKVSIAQILVTMAVCLAIELGMFIWRDGILAWPASAVQTGSAIALILRASGTQHGDWWSLNGIQYFILAAVIGLGSKYLIRPGGSHIFNPANAGIVWVLLVIGPRFTFPQYLWWGPLSVPVVLALAVIFLGALWLLRRPVGMIPMAVSFIVPFAALVGVFALAGRSFIASWHQGPISGLEYWIDICLSPEVFVFVFFMMSDPKTAPRSPRGRLVYGSLVAVAAAALLLFQTTEFGIKLAILSGLTAVCALVPLIERRAIVTRRALRSLLTPSVLAAAIIAVSAPAVTLSLIGDTEVVQVERGTLGIQ